MYVTAFIKNAAAVLLPLTLLATCMAGAEKKKPSHSAVPQDETLIRYGQNLILHTATYLGPKGRVAQISNGMACSNCHFKGGTQLFGNAFVTVAATYPKYRERSGRMESVAYRINECMERSLNGKPLDSTSLEMKAMIAFINKTGYGVLKKLTPGASGTALLPYLARAADPQKGRMVYKRRCQSCHGADGAGTFAPDSVSYTVPPLWGNHSYNVSAGLYRLSKLAGLIKNNMPLGVTWQNPQLTDEEAWDVAAFINTQPRPVRFFSYDWPVLSSKPVDYPFGPYSDSFSEVQHKYGPFGVLKKALVRR